MPSKFSWKFLMLSDSRPESVDLAVVLIVARVLLSLVRLRSFPLSVLSSKLLSIMLLFDAVFDSSEESSEMSLSLRKILF